MSRILVIDDARNLRKMVRLTLSQIGHDVDEAEDGQTGLRKFGDSSRWDLTLVDQRMPHHEGLEVVQQARQLAPTSRLILMTAFDNEELARQVLELGAIDFLRKPFSTSTLRLTVATALQLQPTVLPQGGTNQSLAEQATMLPEPGHEGFVIPRRSYLIKGFSFWPMKIEASVHPRGMSVGRCFQMSDGSGKYTTSFVGIVPHLLEQLRRETGWKIDDSNDIWEQVCGQALLNYIWKNSQLPPATLPVYEIPLDLRHNRAAHWNLETT